MTGRRALIGLIGANIQGSLSPALHEDAFAAHGMRGHYHLMDVDVGIRRSLGELLEGARSTGFLGVNVTFPFKEAVLPLLDETSPEARQIGAVNTVTIDRSGRTHGYNTDRSGFRRSFEEGLGRVSVAGQTVLLVGAGGAGRAVAFALLDLGAARILIHDTDAERASRLAADLNAQPDGARAATATDPASALAGAAGAVNATPIGMTGFLGIPLPIEAVRAGHWVADVIYSPLETELVKAARAKGARVLGGSGMCVHQAAEAFYLFTGLTADVPRMQRVFAAAAAARGQATTARV
jgi:quinate/shikimate dehydrogenase (NAD+)